MKKIIAVALTAIIFAGLIMMSITAATETQIILHIGVPIMTVNNTEREIDDSGTAPVIVNSRTLIPVRAVVEAMGGTVIWDGDTQTVTLVCGDNEITLTIDSSAAYLNGTVQTLDVAPTIINDRTMLPIRFIAESFGYDVEWDEIEQKISITSKSDTADTADTTESGDTLAFLDDSHDEGGKILIAYFSQIDNVPLGADAATYATPYSGNVRDAAETIQSLTGGDLFEITTEQTYPQLHSECSQQAYAELEDDYRPTLTSHVENMDEYDTVFIGFPIWVYVEPMAIRSFLEEYDFSGKRIIPYCVSMAVSVEDSVSDIKRLCPNAQVDNGNSFSTESDSTEKIKDWIEDLDLN